MSYSNVRPLLVLSAVVAALAGLLFGYDAGVISGAILYVQQSFTISAMEKGLIVSVVPFGALIASALGGRLNDLLGRKRILFITAGSFIIGSLFSAFSPNVDVLMFGRLIIGIAIGIGSFSAPLYISEIAVRDARGALVTLNQFAIVVGIFLAYIIDYAFGFSAHPWQWMFACGVVPAVILFVAIFWLPESPRWLMMKFKTNHAVELLQRIHGNEMAKAEFVQLQNVVEHERLGFRGALQEGFLRVLLLGVMVSILTQAIGINAIIYYAPTVLKLTGFNANTTAILATMGVGIINVLFTIIAIRFLDSVGRRKLLMIGVSGIVISLIVLTISFAVGIAHSTVLAWIVLACMLLFVACQAFSTGPACWLIPAEIFPTNVRGLGMGISVACNWGANVIVAAVFPIVLQTWGGAVAFAIFLVIALITWGYFYYFLPETRRVSLETIEANLRAGKPTRQLGR